jgi:hypothetical protein
LISITLLLVTLPLHIVVAGEKEETQKEGEESRQALELFLGNTNEDSENGFTVGLAYGYRLTELFGAGAFWEYAADPFDKWSAAVALLIYPYKGLRFELAPGLEHDEGENEFLFRTGVAYEFEIGRWSITPEFNVDFVDGEESYVYGLSFGWGF